MNAEKAFHGILTSKVLPLPAGRKEKTLNVWSCFTDDFNALSYATRQTAKLHSLPRALAAR